MALTLNNILVTLVGNAADEMIADYEVSCDDDSAIFGDVVSCVSGEVLS